MQVQTVLNSSKQAYMRGMRVLEINPGHPIIKELRDKVARDNELPDLLFFRKSFTSLHTNHGWEQEKVLIDQCLFVR